MTVDFKKKELEQLKYDKKEMEQGLTNSIFSMMGVLTVFGISCITKWSLPFSDISLYDLNVLNAIANTTMIGAVGSEVLLGFKTKSIISKIHEVDTKIHEKKEEITYYKIKEIEEASEIVEKVVERENAPKTYIDDYSKALNFSDENMEKSWNGYIEQVDDVSQELDSTSSVDKAWVLKK